MQRGAYKWSKNADYDKFQGSSTQEWRKEHIEREGQRAEDCNCHRLQNRGTQFDNAIRCQLLSLEPQTASNLQELQEDTTSINFLRKVAISSHLLQFVKPLGQ